MSEHKNDGGSAFPVTVTHRVGEVSTTEVSSLGMSMRDYFAAHAPGVGDQSMWAQGESSVAIDAARAYRWADAMLKARHY